MSYLANRQTNTEKKPPWRI